MSRAGWHILRCGESLVLSRRPGAAVGGPGIWAETSWAETWLPGDLRPAVLAHEIRKDVWRALRRLRGFSPVIEIQRREEAVLWVRAGGAAATPPPAALQARLEAVLQNARLRARWIAHARKAPK